MARARSTAAGAWRRSRRGRRQAIAFFLFLAPWIVGFLVFQLGPMVASAVLMFHDYDILSPPRWSGLANLRKMLLEDDLFWKALRVTALYTAAAVPIHVVLGYSLALLLNREVHGLSFWRTAYYLPAIVPVVATSYLWGWMLNKDFGPLNGLLWALLGIRGPSWLGSQEWVIPAFVLMAAWTSGGGLVLYLAAMQQVPTAYYDAAKVDGANAWQRLRHITLPMTSFVIFFTFVTGVIGTFQVFTAGFVLTDGGPNNASLFYVLYLYKVGWKFLQMGYAATLAWLLFVLILGLTVVMLLTSKRWVYYEGEERG